MSDFELKPTNTLAMASLDALKNEGLEDPKINGNISKLATMDLDESYMIKTINFINESNKEFTDNKITLYNAISESAGDQGIILESFSEFFSKAKDIIDKFLAFIKSLFSRFITELMRLVSSDNYIKKHKDDLKGFGPGDEFEFDGYNFTFSPGCPKVEPMMVFNSDLFADLATATNNGKLTLANMKSANSSIDYNDDYDKFRASVIGKDGTSIYAEDFAEELFKVFRDDDMSTSDITIDSSKVNESLRRFLDYKKTKSAAEKDNREIEKKYDALKKQVKEITKRNGDLDKTVFNATMNGVGIQIDDSVGNIIPGDLLVQIDVYTKRKIDQIQEVSNIHALAFSAKLDALKCCYKQDRAILYTALSKVQRTDAKRGN